MASNEHVQASMATGPAAIGVGPRLVASYVTKMWFLLEFLFYGHRAAALSCARKHCHFILHPCTSSSLLQTDPGQ